MGVKLPYLTESNKETVGSTGGVCHGRVPLPHQSTSSFSRPLWPFTRADSMEVHDRAVWQNRQAAELGGSRLWRATLCVHQPDTMTQARKPIGQMISHWEQFIFRVQTLLGLMSLTVYRGMQVKFSQDCNDRTQDTAIICNV